MGVLKVLNYALVALLFVSYQSFSQPFFQYQVGTKVLKRDVKGQDLNFYDVRPYIQAGIYKNNLNSNLSYGTSLNISPNLFDSDIGNQLHWKVFDASYTVNSKNSVVFSAGALRNSRETPAWGYSLGLGYDFFINQTELSIHINVARTNTDIGGSGANSGAKDNMVWIDFGFVF